MNLRDHIEVAVQLARLVLPTSDSRSLRPVFEESRFWDHVSYLEHLWTKEQNKKLRRVATADRELLAEEILASQLLIRCVAAATGASDRWRMHVRKAEVLLAGELQGDDSSASAARLGRLWKRLSHWGDFLVSRSSRGETYCDDAERCREFQENHQPDEGTVWSLLTLGICRAVPDRTLVDLSRAAVHRTLQERACSLISADDFLRDGRLKPGWMRRIERSLHTDGTC